MLSIAHTVISLPFGIYMTNPWLIFASAFIMHILADTLLHWNIFPDQFKRYPIALVALDILSGVVLAYFITGEQFLTISILVAIAGGNAPDVMHGVWEIIGKKNQDKYLTWAKPFFTWHDKIQLETESITKGVISQVALGIIAILLVLR